MKTSEGFLLSKVEMRNETASHHYKQTQMGGTKDGYESWKISFILVSFALYDDSVAETRILALGPDGKGLDCKSKARK